jgi:DNA replicative helicase MCM subunit Mcm2 (Cdc46/Mcm family)
MKCNSCANREICIHFATIQRFIFDDKHGLGSLNPDIVVEIIVKECPYYKKQKQPKKEEELTTIMVGATREKLLKVLNVIVQLEKENGYAPKEEVIQQLQKIGIKPEEADKLIQTLLREGTIYVPKDGYLKKT